MPIDRDALRTTFINNDEIYDSILARRGQILIEQHATKRLRYPNRKEMKNISTIDHIWKLGDKYWKLAHIHYGDPELWWIIGWFNQKPTEVHCTHGDLIMIPFPLERLYRYFGI